MDKTHLKKIFGAAGIALFVMLFGSLTLIQNLEVGIMDKNEKLVSRSAAPETPTLKIKGRYYKVTEQDYMADGLYQALIFFSILGIAIIAAIGYFQRK